MALEPTGTYGDPLRQALQRAGLQVQRVSPKQASDYAEVFDGVPSQHDGKDAAVVAELSAQGRSWKAQALVDSARQTLGVALGRWEEERLRRYACQIQHGQGEMRAARRRLCVLTRAHAALRAMGAVVGVPTACVLWVELGDPRAYHCGPAYRKAMGLNLAERSSGQWQGKLKISKRGSSKARRWLYLAALRWVRNEPVRRWYLRQKAPRRGEGKPALIGVMRKLALALYQVGGRGEAFDRQRLYGSLTTAAAESV